jgi:enoyl-CoA hydratase
MPTTFETERSGRVLTVRFDNPPRNYMDRIMVRELTELLDSLDGDGSTGAVILTGKNDGSFITHYDVEEILEGSEGFGVPVSARAAGASMRAIGGVKRMPGAGSILERTPASGMLELKAIHDALLRMNRMDKVFIAAINGSAVAGACELALACDIRYVGTGAGPIGLPEMTLGFCPGAGGTQRLTRAIGASRALELILEARPVSPEEALEIGLVHRVVPDPALLAEAEATAERMARRAPISIAAAKHTVLEGAAKPLAEGLAEERRGFLASCSRPAAARAMRAYIERIERDGGPNFTDPDALSEWREGKVVDLVSDD